MKPGTTLVASCTCGRVEVKAFGAPIASNVCYCDDCQRGSRQIETLPHAGPVMGADGGTAYIIFRKDRISCTKGADLLRPYKLEAGSRTSRVVASCCNSPMFMNFDSGPFWVSAYRARFQGDLPPLDMRVCTRFKPAGVLLPDDVPAFSGYPLRFMLRLLVAGVGMRLGF